MAILGIDEVGRGPLAGPLVVGAVVLPEEEQEWFKELKDSKKLSAKKRESLSEVIWKETPAVGLGWVSPKELDEVGMSEALRLATRRAVKSVQGLHAAFSQIVIDGKTNFLSLTSLSKYVTTVVKADDKIREVSAASIVAKVARDAYMKEAGTRFPEYGFEKHMGYGTLKHREAIMRVGVCPEHRRSFEPIKSMVGYSRTKSNVIKNTTFVGAMGEEAVASYLVSAGHEVVARNFKTYFYEIDIVSVCEGRIYFTEVKYRKSDYAGGGLTAVDKKKLERMKFAAECFLKYYKWKYGEFDPMLAVADVYGEDFTVREWVALD
ncbi:ribonuclease HII [Candidatus Saccharibacteria bacterium]|nr:ribonuclease HII [Candidatus Saccharibacteria bacterium]MBR3232841.1 ribonuclease HII [Candidatus Saccharibacteria bacterium]